MGEKNSNQKQKEEIMFFAPFHLGHASDFPSCETVVETGRVIMPLLEELRNGTQPKQIRCWTPGYPQWGNKEGTDT